MRLVESETDDSRSQPYTPLQPSSPSVSSSVPLHTHVPNMMAIRRFKDCVHDYMPFGPAICAIIDTPQFQRLRYLKQLGTSYYVWPGASHNRFEHSLGVAHLAQLMVEHLHKNQPELGITPREIQCVTIAGLCHDLGHGPFSHVWDGTFIPKALPGTKWKHEDASEMMFDSLIQENDLEIDEQDVTFVKALIAGDPTRCKDHPEKPFLFQIVANKANGLDVDKFDYFARDTHAIEQKALSVTSRLISSARVINNEITFDIKDATQVYEVYHTRFTLHKSIYNHKTAKAIEYMIVDALLAAEPHLKIARQIFDPHKFLWLTDDIVQRIESSEVPELAEARAILLRVKKRDLYKAVDYKVFPWHWKGSCASYFTPKRIVAATKKLYMTKPIGVEDRAETAGNDETRIERAVELVDAHPEMSDSGDIDMDDLEALGEEHVIVDLVARHHGMAEKNPLEFVKFYSKQRPNFAEAAGDEVISLALPQHFGEVFLRIYTRESRFFGLVQAGFRELLSKVTDENNEFNLALLDDDDEEFTLPPAPNAIPEAPPLTPPDTEEVPSTPPPMKRSLSRVVSGGSELMGSTKGSFSTPNPHMSVPPSFKPDRASPTREARGAAKGKGKEKEKREASASPVRRSKRAKKSSGSGSG